MGTMCVCAYVGETEINYNAETWFGFFCKIHTGLLNILYLIFM